MSPAAVVLVTIGAATMTGWLFRILDTIEAPRKERRA